MKTFQEHMQKSFNYAPVLSAPELSQNITEVAFNTSNLLRNIDFIQADNPSYKNVFVTHPSISEVVEGGVIPKSTVQTYSTTATDFTKFASSIELSNEVMNFSKFDITGNTADLVGKVLSDTVATFVTTELASRETETPDHALNEDLQIVKSGVAGGWGLSAEVYALFRAALPFIPDVYDVNTKLYLNKNNLAFLLTVVDDLNGQVWIIQEGKLFGLYELVVTDQLDDNTMILGDMGSAIDVVTLQGKQTVNAFTKPDAVCITETNQYSICSKDMKGIVALKAML